MSAVPADVVREVTIRDHADWEHDVEKDAKLQALEAHFRAGVSLKRKRDLLREILKDAEAAYAAWEDGR